MIFSFFFVLKFQSLGDLNEFRKKIDVRGLYTPKHLTSRGSWLPTPPADCSASKTTDVSELNPPSQLVIRYHWLAFWIRLLGILRRKIVDMSAKSISEHSASSGIKKNHAFLRILNDHIWKTTYWKIDFSFVSEHYATFELKVTFEGGVCMSLNRRGSMKKRKYKRRARKGKLGTVLDLILEVTLVSFRFFFVRFARVIPVADLRSLARNNN